ncbi:MAG TPA: secondary thiamine-phosphate synthase enzyme YjbQ [bacterium]|nr:secondary thiamine-phosphate synthase enzyme YjbQ [bacterium]
MRWQTLELATSRRVQVLDVTAAVDELCRRSDVRDGLLVVCCEHTTAALCLNEAEPRLLADLEAWLERLVPRGAGYAHDRVDDNADAHLRALLLGHSVVLPVEGGRLRLGAWQRILFVELDGPRARRLRVGV